MQQHNTNPPEPAIEELCRLVHLAGEEARQRKKKAMEQHQKKISDAIRTALLQLNPK